jgi:hypothetical protein
VLALPVVKGPWSARATQKGFVWPVLPRSTVGLWERVRTLSFSNAFKRPQRRRRRFPTCATTALTDVLLSAMTTPSPPLPFDDVCGADFQRMDSAFALCQSAEARTNLAQTECSQILKESSQTELKAYFLLGLIGRLGIYHDRSLLPRLGSVFFIEARQSFSPLGLFTSFSGWIPSHIRSPFQATSCVGLDCTILLRQCLISSISLESQTRT